ncbi:DUF3800 domain-containing protein [Mycobacterium sp. CVI_P3]|uniref:DUF3800 domain-containing protein n=1 Tax=Mycobacterium pinniadriaticum TaxID=2994102 RepID=A0ABT3SIQ5_9MYCO|nr:DUF3800 domain-containing protein [Mycobacterium pinniadriaticum]MCX2932998.1 DUF3800 domain-containing protein [Mycobacterium pinniadriaticum]MCX2939421.1 DUF3800 domain-containing protein [Mycobacterium pinniadriaticum]
MNQPAAVIVCDESGSDGENLAKGEARVFAHGSTDLDADDAARIVDGLRGAVRFGGYELKSASLLKAEGRRKKLLELFAPTGPLPGRAKVVVIDKPFMIAAKVIDLVIEEAAHARGIDLYTHGEARAMAMTLFREGPGAYGEKLWQKLLGDFVSFVRRTQRNGSKTTQAELVETISHLRRGRRRRALASVMDQLWEGREHLADYRPDLRADSAALGTLDPLWPSIAATARAWHEVYSTPIHLVHDRQAALTPTAVSAFLQTIGVAWPNMALPVPITDLEQTDSRHDPRVQIADLVAGVGAWAANKALDGTISDDEANLLRPYLIDDSMWGDPTSWFRLAGRPLQ